MNHRDLVSALLERAVKIAGAREKGELDHDAETLLMDVAEIVGETDHFDAYYAATTQAGRHDALIRWAREYCPVVIFEERARDHTLSIFSPDPDRLWVRVGTLKAELMRDQVVGLLDDLLNWINRTGGLDG